MSVVAYRDNILAVDSQMTCADTKDTCEKFDYYFRENGELVVYAHTGELAKGIELVAWHKAGADKDKYPEFQQNKDRWTRLIFADKSGLLEYVEDKYPIPHKPTKYAAWGIGREAAYGALHAGASAAGAVAAACAHVMGCGGPIHVFDFNTNDYRRVQV